MSYRLSATMSTDEMEKNAAALGNVVDLFCGVSGFGLGAINAGANVVASIDKDSALTATHHENLPSADLHLIDLANATPNKMARLLQRTYGSIDGVIGGPPCQGFSEIGRRDKGDERNSLLFQFAKIVNAVQPRYFVFENVPGLLFTNTKPMLDRALSSLSRNYDIPHPAVLDAKDYGVPTSRQRVFVIGFHKHMGIDPSFEGIQAKYGVKRATTVRHAISDLPAPVYESWNEAPWRIWGRYPKLTQKRSAYAVSRKKLPDLMTLSNTEVRRNARKGLVSGVRGTNHTPQVVERLNRLTPGSSDPVSKCPRLTWDGVCPTLRAGTGPDRGSYQSIRPIHPAEPRVITLREAARLQGFPDWYQFHATTWHGFRMLGNSVSPPVATVVLRHIASLMNGSVCENDACPTYG